VRGQRLFVRPIDPTDSEAVREFLARYSASSTVPSTGLVGKLVGDLAAVVAIEITASAIRIDDIVVAPDLRRKRIGRFMIDEVGVLAVKMERRRLVVERPGDAGEFFRRVGFESEGAQWVRRVK
jgi:N-acetylglutamate synthase-like GNAT family acetyltransferase